MVFPSQTTSSPPESSSAGEAEAGSGGDQPGRGITNRRLIETMVRGAGFGRLPVNQKLPIGSVDLLMPEKTHGRSGAGCLHLCGLLELLRRPVTQRRVQSAAVVVLVDELLNGRRQVFQVPVLVGVDLFPFKRFEEAFATGIVVRI